MAANREEKIRERAYAIWLDEGCVDGRDREHWLEAEKEIDQEEATSAKSDPLPGSPLPQRD